MSVDDEFVDEYSNVKSKFEDMKI